MQRVLEGTKVLDMGHVVAGPSGASVLADWGAEVIKIEPLRGEWIRHYHGHMEADPVVEVDGEEINWLVELLNRGKKGLAIDLKNELGRAVLHRMVEHADVFLSNYEASTLEKLDLDYDTLSAINPRLVYAMLTGFGPTGPDKDERGYDQLLWGRAGLSDAITNPGRELVVMRPAMLDRMTGDHMALGIVGALLWREKSGLGQRIDISLFHSALWTLGLDVEPALMGVQGSRFDRTKSKIPLANIYRSRDHRWIMLSMMASEDDWSSLCAVIERPDLVDEPRFADHQSRTDNCEELIRLLDEIFAGKDLDTWEVRLREHDCIYSRVQTFDEVVKDPQVRANAFICEGPHPASETLEYVASPVTFSRSRAAVTSPAPEVGEHTDEALSGVGFSPEEIDGLRREGVIA